MTGKNFSNFPSFSSGSGNLGDLTLFVVNMFGNRLLDMFNAVCNGLITSPDSDTDVDLD